MGSGSDKIFSRMFEDEEKVKLRRLEPAIQKFTKIVIPTDLERLRKHQINIEKYQRCRIWDKLHEEHINAGRTVQQLRSNIREMEKLCLKVQKDDLILLKRMIDPVKDEASAATAEFLQLHLASVEELKKQFNDEETLLQPSLTRSMTVGGNVLYKVLFLTTKMKLIKVLISICRDYRLFVGLQGSLADHLLFQYAKSLGPEQAGNVYPTDKIASRIGTSSLQGSICL